MGVDNEATARADRQTGWLIALCAVVFLATRASLAWSQVDEFSLWWLVASGVAAGSFLTMAVFGRQLPMPILRVLWLWTPLLLLALQLLSYAAYQHPGGDALPWVWSLEAAAGSMLVLVLRARYAFALAVFSGVSVALSAWLFAGAVPSTILEVTPPHVSNIAFVAIFLGIRQRITALNESETLAREASERSARAVAETAQRARLGRVVHDEVLSVLLAARMFHGATPAALRIEATQALAVLDSADPAPGSAEVPADAALAQLQSRLQRIAPQTGFILRHDDGQVSVHAVTHMVAAVAEALRNAVRHARATTITVQATVTGGGIHVIVTDDGVGFDETVLNDAATRGRLGVAESIRGRMRDIGAEASVRSTPGRGTEIQLRWEP
ncbi:sensor histidine kinase [Microbacterium sp. 2216-1]|uniref:sensor histidine kinase n=1 Tax=Microbacterium sp. 2216-1 TaxID=3390053 RepID=UPI003976884B